MNRQCGVVGVVPGQAKEMQRCPRQLHTKDRIRLEWGDDDGEFVAFDAREPGPDVVADE